MLKYEFGGQVSWKGVQDPSIHDAVALLVPADADPRDTAPAKHRWATESDTYLSNGTGSMRYALVFFYQQSTCTVSCHEP